MFCYEFCQTGYTQDKYVDSSCKLRMKLKGNKRVHNKRTCFFAAVLFSLRLKYASHFLACAV